MEEKTKVTGNYMQALKDPRVWVLFVIYGACFGIELTVNNVAALYFMDYLTLTLVTAVCCRVVWSDEPLCPDFGRLFRRQLRIALGPEGTRVLAVHVPVL